MSRTLGSPRRQALVNLIIQERKAADLTQVQVAKKLRRYQSYEALSFHDGGLWWNGITDSATPIELAVVQHITHMSGADILLV